MADHNFNRAGLINEHKKTPIAQEYINDKKGELGAGTFGSVCKARNKATNAIVAIKSIAKKNMKDEEKFKAEIHIMKDVDHPNIVRLYETYEDAKLLYLVMELCEGGELFDKIIDEGFFSEKDASNYMKQILSAIYYLHENNIVHRDLKPENFLLESKAKEGVWPPLKVIDFGLSCKFECKNKSAKKLTTRAGTPYYVAPEVLKGSYDHKSDVWSCGVLMYVLLCGYPPFYGDTDAQILGMVRAGSFDFPEEEWADISAEAKSLIGQLLGFDPEKRIEAKDSLESKWFAMNKEASAEVGKNTIAKLKAFHKTSKLKKIALTAIARSLPAPQIKELTNIFKALDVNGDGTVTYQEVVDTVKKEKLVENADEILAIMKDIDSDGSGSIDYTEFVAATLDKRLYMNEENAWIAFRQFDLDGDGKITSQELEQVLGADGIGDHYDKASVLLMIKEADKNGDGMIDFEEFKEHMIS